MEFQSVIPPIVVLAACAALLVYLGKKERKPRDSFTPSMLPTNAIVMVIGLIMLLTGGYLVSLVAG